MSLRLSTAFVVAILPIACGPGEDRAESEGTWVGTTTGEDRAESDGAWVGTITTEGNVTTVVNESGSVWGGTATLVEEASIGVDAGAEEYMFGAVRGVHATDQHIYVVDFQVPAIRVYDLDGTHLRDLGREGQGPGEYVWPSMITVDDEGRVFVLDFRMRRLNVFTESGESLGAWSAQDVQCCTVASTEDGGLWVRKRLRGIERTDGRLQHALQQIGPAGDIGEAHLPREPDFDRVEVEADARFGDRVVALPLPFSPDWMWEIGPFGTMIVGASDRYRFEVQRRDGSALAVERYWTPVPVLPNEAAWHTRFFVAMARWETVPEDWTWDGAGMPTSKPAFSGILPAKTGEIWVRRQGLGEQVADCVDNPLQVSPAEAAEAPCWRDRMIIDVFDATGRFVGDVDVPAGLDVHPSSTFVDGDRVVAVIEDDDGTIMVKRYRLVLPGEQ